MKQILLILLITATLNTFAQDAVFQWVQQAGGEGVDTPVAMIFDNEGNLIVTGNFKETASFEHEEIISEGNKDVFLAKYDIDGNRLWLKNFGGTDFDGSSSVTVDKNNNIYLCGNFKKTCVFDNQTLESTDYMDNFVVKFDESGNKLWLKHIETDTKGKKAFLACDDDNLYYAGSFFNDIKIDDTTVKAISNSDIFIAKFDLQGNFEQIVTAGGFNPEQINDIKCGINGEIFITGSFEDEIVFPDITLIAKDREDVFIAKLIDMNFEWAIQAGGNYRDYGQEIVLRNEKLFLLGSFSGKTVIGDDEIEAVGVLDAFVSCFDFNGNNLWTKSIGGNANEYTSSIAVNYDGNVYITGSYRGKIQKGDYEIESINFTNDIFLAKFSCDGDFIKLNSYGTTKHDKSVNILTDNSGYVYLYGEFGNKIELGKISAETENQSDIFITKFFDCDNSEPLELGNDVVLCGANYTIVPNKDYETYTWGNGTTTSTLTVDTTNYYKLTVTDEYSCEFTDSVHLTLHPIPDAELPADTVLCEGSLVVLEAKEGYQNYWWHNLDSDSHKITARDIGIYHLDITTEHNCIDSFFVNVSLQPDPEFSLRDDIEVFQAEALTLNAEGGYTEYYWNTAEDTQSIDVITDVNFGSYEYWVEVTDSSKCVWQDRINIRINEPQESTGTDSLTVEIYPNPTNGIFTVDITNIEPDENIRFEIYSATQQILFENQVLPGIENYEETINFSSHADGTYTLKVYNGQFYTETQIFLEK
jgi:hypothetical protein